MATVSCGSASDRYQFVSDYKDQLSIAYLCKWFGVSKTGYYDWIKRKPSKRKLEDAQWKILIKDIFVKSMGRYGSPRVYKHLKKQGYSIGKHRVARLMAELGLVGRVVRVTTRAPGIKKFAQAGGNLRLGKDGPTGINQVWVADITYIKVKDKWHYYSVIMDLFSRRIVGWSLDKQRTQEVTKRTLLTALKKRKPKPGLIFHTDRGIEYRGSVFQKELKDHDIIHSVIRPGHCTDKGHMESFFHSLKGELIRGRQFNTIKKLRSI